MSNLIVSKEEILSTYKDYKKGFAALKKYENWFPIKTSPRLAGIIGDLIGDGHLQDNPKWRLDYTSKSKKELRRFGSEVYSLFKVKGKIRECKANRFGKTFNYGVNCKVLARTLKLCGVPTGAKVLKEFDIPEWVLKDKECFRRFVCRLFSCEGRLDTSKNNPSIELEMWKRAELLPNSIKFFNEIRTHLDKYFDIKCSNVFSKKFPIKTRSDNIKTNSARIKIKRKDSIMKFYNNIRFDDKIKKDKLLRILELKGLN